MTTKMIKGLAALAVLSVVWGCGDDSAADVDAGTRPDVPMVDLGPTPDDGALPPLRCTVDSECVPATAAAPCALTFCDRVTGRCVTTGPDMDADGHADEACDPGVGATAMRGDDCDDADPMRFPGRPEMCDSMGFDEDCDSRTVGGGRPGDGDADGDGFVSIDCTNRDDATGEVLPGPDCDDTNPDVHPRVVDGPPDTCNGIDDDCDGETDVGCGCSADQPCGPSGVIFGGTSICAMGIQRCSGGTLGMCEGAVYPRAETCEIERFDDDCDGVANEPEVCECNDGETGLCGGAPDGAHNDEPSACRRGTRSCLAGRWQSCEGAVGPSPEACDGRIDDDCDGTLDEDCGCTDGATRPCGTDVGQCSAGTQACSSGTWGDCSGGIGPQPEACDGDDDDCNGTNDDGCSCTNGATRPCGIDTGECVQGTETCAAGVWGACSGAVGPSAEACDGDDDDCNGTNDDGCSCTNGATRPCGTDTGDCVAGIETCAAGVWGACSGIGPGPTEDCDGGDEDCDGMTDEGCACTSGMTRPCGGGPPGTIRTPPAVCMQGTEACTGGVWGGCSGNVEPTTEVCDSGRLDEDCDGMRNEGCAITQISAGTDFSCALRQSGTVICWGANSVGQLGRGTTSATTTIDAVNGITTAVEVTSGGGHSCARLASGRVMCWGGNADGQLGNGASGVGTYSSSPVEVSGLTNATRVAAGGANTCVLRASGGPQCWGANSYGQLGNGGTSPSSTPSGVIGLSGLTTDISTGAHSCAVSSSHVYCWGLNWGGQLGNGVSSGISPNPTPVEAIGLTDAIEVTTDSFGTCARRSAGGAMCWGFNDRGQCGTGASSSQERSPVAVTMFAGATEIDSGNAHTCARLASGVRCWGNGVDGQLGSGFGGIGYFSTTPVVATGLTATSSIASGSQHTCALTASAVMCWGDNGAGQLGTGATSADVLSPMSAAIHF